MYTSKIFKDYPWLIFISRALFEIDGFLDADGGAGFKNGTAKNVMSSVAKWVVLLKICKIMNYFVKKIV